MQSLGPVPPLKCHRPHPMLPCLQVRGHGAAHHPAAHRQRLAAQPPLAHAGERRQWGGGTLGNMVVGWVAQQCIGIPMENTRWERCGIPSNARRYAIQTGLPTPPARHLPFPQVAAFTSFYAGATVMAVIGKWA